MSPFIRHLKLDRDSGRRIQPRNKVSGTGGRSKVQATRLTRSSFCTSVLAHGLRSGRAGMRGHASHVEPLPREVIGYTSTTSVTKNIWVGSTYHYVARTNNLGSSSARSGLPAHLALPGALACSTQSVCCTLALFALTAHAPVVCSRWARSKSVRPSPSRQCEPCPACRVVPACRQCAPPRLDGIRHAKSVIHRGASSCEQRECLTTLDVRCMAGILPTCRHARIWASQNFISQCVSHYCASRQIVRQSSLRS